ncbi:MAG: hypothetical protein QNK31_00340 [Porticoccus sp.]|nr:hypothetical protein [Porticoccus sp.]
MAAYVDVQHKSNVERAGDAALWTICVSRHTHRTVHLAHVIDSVQTPVSMGFVKIVEDQANLAATTPTVYLGRALGDGFKVIDATNCITKLWGIEDWKFVSIAVRAEELTHEKKQIPFTDTK